MDPTPFNQATSIYQNVIEPTLLNLLPAQMNSDPAKVMLVAIGLQESRFIHRYQVVPDPRQKGPARGFWQFEAGGGCAGVLRHEASRFWMHSVCSTLGCPPLSSALWRQIETDDQLACVAARLLLFTDPKRLPTESGAAWDLYARTWRPGKPHRATWGQFYEFAQQLVLQKDL